MTLTKKDKQDMAEMIVGILKAMNSADLKEASKGAKIEGTPRDLHPASERPEILKGLTMAERKAIWGTINKDNILGNKYKAGHNLYKTKNIDGRPNITYTEAYFEFLVPIAKDLKYTTKQMTSLKGLVLKALKHKITTQKNPKAKQWVEKALGEITEG